MQLTNGQLGLVVTTTGTNAATYALDAQGGVNLELPNVSPTITAQGTLDVQINTNSTNTTVTEGGTTVTVPANTALSVSGMGLTLQVGGFVYLSGNFAFADSTAGTTNTLTVSASGVTAFVGTNHNGSDETGVKVQSGNFGLVVTTMGTNAATYALDAQGSVNLELPGVTPTITAQGTLDVQINTNTTSTALTEGAASDCARQHGPVRFGNGVDPPGGQLRLPQRQFRLRGFNCGHHQHLDGQRFGRECLCRHQP